MIEGLLHAARQARALHGRHVDLAELQIEVALEIDVVLRKMAAIAALERRIAALYEELDPQSPLKGIPGAATKASMHGYRSRWKGLLYLDFRKCETPCGMKAIARGPVSFRSIPMVIVTPLSSTIITSSHPSCRCHGII
ncbi:MAG: hypothetical protein M3N26_08650 [Pseudomonadota bacterium]|nr:hypothetical protein [Pseudomonadota bacterium]